MPKYDSIVIYPAGCGVIWLAAEKEANRNKRNVAGCPNYAFHPKISAIHPSCYF